MNSVSRTIAALSSLLAVSTGCKVEAKNTALATEQLRPRLNYKDIMQQSCCTISPSATESGSNPGQCVLEERQALAGETTGTPSTAKHGQPNAVEQLLMRDRDPSIDPPIATKYDDPNERLVLLNARDALNRYGVETPMWREFLSSKVVVVGAVGRPPGGSLHGLNYATGCSDDQHHVVEIGKRALMLYRMIARIYALTDSETPYNLFDHPTEFVRVLATSSQLQNHVQSLAVCAQSGNFRCEETELSSHDEERARNLYYASVVAALAHEYAHTSPVELEYLGLSEGWGSEMAADSLALLALDMQSTHCLDVFECEDKLEHDAGSEEMARGLAVHLAAMQIVEVLTKYEELKDTTAAYEAVYKIDWEKIAACKKQQPRPAHCPPPEAHPKVALRAYSAAGLELAMPRARYGGKSREKMGGDFGRLVLSHYYVRLPEQLSRAVLEALVND